MAESSALLFVACVGAIVVADALLVEKGGGSGMKKLAMVGLGLSCVFAAATWGLQLFGFAGGAAL